jgi:hypothetical protein
MLFFVHHGHREVELDRHGPWTGESRLPTEQPRHAADRSCGRRAPGSSQHRPYAQLRERRFLCSRCRISLASIPMTLTRSRRIATRVSRRGPLRRRSLGAARGGRDGARRRLRANLLDGDRESGSARADLTTAARLGIALRLSCSAARESEAVSVASPRF